MRLLLLVPLANAAPEFTLLLGANPFGEPVGDYNGGGTATYDAVFEFDEPGLADTVSQDFKIQNSGDEDLTLTFAIWDDDELPIDASGCDVGVLAPDEECVVTITAQLEVASVGEYSADAEITTNDPAQPTFELHAQFLKSKPEGEGCQTAPVGGLLGLLVAVGALRRRRRG